MFHFDELNVSEDAPSILGSIGILSCGVLIVIFYDIAPLDSMAFPLSGFAVYSILLYILVKIRLEARIKLILQSVASTAVNIDSNVNKKSNNVEDKPAVNSSNLNDENENDKCTWKEEDMKLRDTLNHYQQHIEFINQAARAEKRLKSSYQYKMHARKWCLIHLLLLVFIWIYFALILFMHKTQYQLNTLCWNLNANKIVNVYPDGIKRCKSITFVDVSSSSNIGLNSSQLNSIVDQQESFLQRGLIRLDATYTDLNKNVLNGTTVLIDIAAQCNTFLGIKKPLLSGQKKVKIVTNQENC